MCEFVSGNKDVTVSCVQTKPWGTNIWYYVTILRSKRMKGMLRLKYVIRPSKNANMAGRLKFKINILFYGDNSRAVALGQIKFCIEKFHGHPYNFWVVSFLKKLVNVTMVRNFEVMLVQTLNHCMFNSLTLYNVISRYISYSTYCQIWYNSFAINMITA
jgi:hypothetical protein